MARKTICDLIPPPAWPADVIHDGEHIVVVGRHHYLVESRSDPGSFHVVDLEPVEGAAGQRCTCRSGVVRKTCRHERTVLSLLGHEQR